MERSADAAVRELRRATSRRLTALDERLRASGGCPCVPSAVSPPPADGICSQYSSTALTEFMEHPLRAIAGAGDIAITRAEPRSMASQLSRPFVMKIAVDAT
jgi:hypothetical protein